MILGIRRQHIAMLALSIATVVASGPITSFGAAAAEDRLIPTELPGAYVIAASDEEAASKPIAQKPRMKHIDIPAYPFTAKTANREGWVHLEATITAAGQTQDIKVVDSYPKGIFENAARDEFAKAEFIPGTLNGEPRETRGLRYAFNFTIGGPRGASKDNIRLFQNFLKQFSANQIDDATATLNKLKALFESGELNLTEYARYNDFAARLAFQKRDFVSANEYVTRALSLGALFDSQEALEASQVLKILTDASFQKNDEVVDYYDAWRKKLKHEPNSQVSVFVEGLRSRGFGKGRKIDVLTYKELRERREGQIANSGGK